jgi:rare lipoprotein A
MFLRKINCVTVLLLSCVIIYFYSCAPVPPGVVTPPDSDYITASWYGPKFHGRTTASGERFNMYALTCAHKEFPFGTKLRVTNVKNKKSVDVVVNDRGPFIKGRDLDLAYGSAKEIGFIEQGVGKVKIQYLGRDDRYVQVISPKSAGPSSGAYAIQIGSFKGKSNAFHLKKALKLKYKSVHVKTVYIDKQKFYRVRVGPFKKRERAHSFAKALAEEGYRVLITQRD